MPPMLLLIIVLAGGAFWLSPMARRLAEPAMASSVTSWSRQAEGLDRGVHKASAMAETPTGLYGRSTTGSGRATAQPLAPSAHRSTTASPHDLSYKAIPVGIEELHIRRIQVVATLVGGALSAFVFAVFLGGWVWGVQFVIDLAIAGYASGLFFVHRQANLRAGRFAEATQTWVPTDHESEWDAFERDHAEEYGANVYSLHREHAHAN